MCKNIIVTSKVFLNHNIRKRTSTFPGRNAHNQIQHILIYGGIQYLLYVRALRGAEYVIAHYIVVVKVTERQCKRLTRKDGFN